MEVKCCAVNRDICNSLTIFCTLFYRYISERCTVSQTISAWMIVISCQLFWKAWTLWNKNKNAYLSIFIHTVQKIHAQLLHSYYSNWCNWTTLVGGKIFLWFSENFVYLLCSNKETLNIWTSLFLVNVLWLGDKGRLLDYLPGNHNHIFHIKIHFPFSRYQYFFHILFC